MRSIFTKASRNAFDRALSIAREKELYVLHAGSANFRFSRHARERLELLTNLRERAERPARSCDMPMLRLMGSSDNSNVWTTGRCAFTEADDLIGCGECRQ